MPGQGFDLERFLTCPVLGILRGIPSQNLEPVLEAAVAAGLKHLEITLNTQDAFSIIERAAAGFSGRLTIGAGTVLSPEGAERACNAGATFLVSPTLNTEVARFCRDENIPYFPGAFTPTEIEKAWQAGAAMVKVFPASQLGPAFFKEMRGPFPDIKLMAVGGVCVENVPRYLESGALAVAVGGSVFTRERLENVRVEEIKNDLSHILIAVSKFLTTMTP